MEVKNVLWLLFATSFCCGSEIPGYIDGLIKDLKVQEPSQVHDVVIICLRKILKELTEKIVTEVSLENSVMMPPTKIVVNNQRILAASVVIIVSDVVDKVK